MDVYNTLVGDREEEDFRNIEVNGGYVKINYTEMY
jgi:hypothetical protein